MVDNELEIKKTHCGFCSCRCGVEVWVTNGEVVKISGDKGSGTKGFLCQRPRLAALDFHDDPRRLNYPLKRNGSRGEGKWQRISWQQAMDEIAEKIVRVRETDGPEALACMMGNGTGGARWIGTPLVQSLWDTQPLYNKHELPVASAHCHVLYVRKLFQKGDTP